MERLIRENTLQVEIILFFDERHLVREKPTRKIITSRRFGVINPEILVKEKKEKRILYAYMSLNSRLSVRMLKMQTVGPHSETITSG